MHAGHAHVQLVGVRERAAGHQGGDDRHAGHLGEGDQLGRGVGLDHAATDVEHRALGRGDHAHGLLDLAGVRGGHRAVAGQVHLRRPDEVDLGVLQVLGHVDEDGARAAGGGEVERLGDRLGDVVGVGDHEVVLGHGHGHAADVGFLEGVGAQQGHADLAGDGDDGHGVHLRVGQRGDQVGGAGAGGGDAHADLAGDLRVAGGGVAGALLVAHQDVADLLGVEQRVVQREDRAARNAEYDVRAKLLEGPDDRLRAGHALRRRTAILRGHGGGRGAVLWGGVHSGALLWSGVGGSEHDGPGEMPETGFRRPMSPSTLAST